MGRTCEEIRRQSGVHWPAGLRSTVLAHTQLYGINQPHAFTTTYLVSASESTIFINHSCEGIIAGPSSVRPPRETHSGWPATKHEHPGRDTHMHAYSMSTERCRCAKTVRAAGDRSGNQIGTYCNQRRLQVELILALLPLLLQCSPVDRAARQNRQ